MVAKRIGKILRGESTPAQIMMACVLGSALGFVPGFAQSPGLVVLLILLLVVLNANLGLALMVASVAKIVSLLLMPLSFMVGRVLLDGPAHGLFSLAVNAPVLALLGLEYYVTTGGLLLALVLGIASGMAVIRMIRRIRTRLARLEEGSEVYREWTAKWWVKLLVLVFVGRGAKQNYATLLERKGKVIRPIGVAVCIVVVGLLGLGQSFVSGPLIRSALQRGLEKANGATVDLVAADINLSEGRMTLTGLAMADPNDLDTDLFRAATIEADVSATSLLRKQLRLDRVVISDAVQGAKRATKGRLVGGKPDRVKSAAPEEGEASLDDYLNDAARWQERLVQVRRWLDRISGPATGDETSEAEGTESLRDRLAREVRTLGYARVAADHLVDGSPRFVVGELVAEKVRTDALGGETIDILARNLSTHPTLLADAPSVSIESSAQTLRARLELGDLSMGGGASSVDFSYTGLSVDRIAGDLRAKSARPIAGGTMDVAVKGAIKTRGGVYIDLPLQVTLHNTTIAAAGKSAPVERLTLALGLRGPIDRLRIRFDDDAFANALVAAGAGALAAEVRGRADELIRGKLSDTKF